jgi:hypothetical protein
MGTTRVLPARNTGRTASSRATSIAGDGGAKTNTASVVLMFSEASDTNSSRVFSFHLLTVVFVRAYNFGTSRASQFSPGARGPQPTKLVSRSQ